MTTAPTVLFVCVRNSGKSQMAAGLMRQAAGEKVLALSAGTDPGTKLNALSVAALAEIETRVRALLAELDVPIA
ncbi:low molecular weight phosphatase family protein [Nocardia fusca]|uniref:Phosphotyrosine protein phosphatase I domain-containing protein n=1 Tax=Nocardia fusca TaxID=941183 RepID=A0ABV3F1N0_9NOCA